MASDMMVALPRATRDGHTLFGHNNPRPAGEALALLVVPGRAFAPGQMVRATHVEVPQVRHTHTVLGCRAGARWGYQHGLSNRGVAIGVTSIWTRIDRKPGLTGPDLVRLALERGGSALQAIDVLTDLISRHGQSAEDGEDGSDNAFVVADGREAHVLEACGSHWALQTITCVRAVSGACHLRRDWDRISRGLADLAIEKGWCPQDGNKVDFAEALGKEGANHALALRQWGQATWALEQHHGRLTVPDLRRILAGETMARPVTASEEPAPSCLIAQLSPAPEQVPLAWCSFGARLHFPLMLAGDVPSAFGDEGGSGSRVWCQLGQWQESCRGDARLRSALRGGLVRLQERLDVNARELLGEAAVLRQRGAEDELRSLATSFMQHNFELFEELAASLHGDSGADKVKARPREEGLDAQYAWVGE
jgi:secernin